MIETYGYGHSNRKSYQMADPRVLELFGYSNAEKLISETTFPTTTDPVIDQKIYTLWEEVYAGL